MSTLLPLYPPYWAVLRIKQDGRCDYALKIVKCDKDMMLPYLHFYLHVSFFSTKGTKGGLLLFCWLARVLLSHELGVLTVESGKEDIFKRGKK